MASVRDVCIYLCRHYPKDGAPDLSLDRLIRMVYLCDWKSAITHYEQMTPTIWCYNNYGPYATGLKEMIMGFSGVYSVQSVRQLSDVEVLATDPTAMTPSLSYNDKLTLDFVLDVIASLSVNDFARLVFSTYPILTQPEDEPLDMIKAAQRYIAEVPEVVHST